ncbi:MAG TPA: preprotein translocase subunit SecE [Blastocatellia bacterium]|nr:preprotein translocase subunit SecE [Blastocatellia bacterium]
MSRMTEYSDDDEKALSAAEREASSEVAGERPSRLRQLSFGGRIREFYQNVKLELRKTSWPTRNEVWSTTVVVLIAIFFFGFYLWGVDRLITLGFEALEKVFR